MQNNNMIKYFTTRSRDIIFRGKSIVTGKWIFGYYKQLPSTCDPNEIRDCILGFDKDVWLKVDPETVSQYIGLNDSNGEKLFEGDIVSVVKINPLIEEPTNLSYGFGVIKFSCNKSDCSRAEFQIVLNDHEGSLFFCPGYTVTKVGNIFDNPQLVNFITLGCEF